MSVEFRCNEEIMANAKDNIENIRDYLSDALEIAQNVYEEIESKTHWKGKSQLTMQAFMDLLLQYHKDLTTDGPVDDAFTHLEDFMTNLDGFNDRWVEWGEIGKIE